MLYEYMLLVISMKMEATGELLGLGLPDPDT